MLVFSNCAKNYASTIYKIQAGRQQVMFKRPTQLKPQICHFILLVNEIFSQQQKNLLGNSYVTNDVITLDLTWEDILWQMSESLLRIKLSKL